MAGDVWQWVQDCYHGDYNEAPTDESAWTTGKCSRRVNRGGSWFDPPEFLRSAWRIGTSPGVRDDVIGFRVGRTLTP